MYVIGRNFIKKTILTILIACFTFIGCVENNDDQNGDTNTTSDSESTDIKNGTYSATVDYYNPETNYSATYTLDVEVSDNQVVQIDFPNGGHLDEDHITPADLDDNGDANVDGEDGKTYQVHIEDTSDPE